MRNIYILFTFLFAILFMQKTLIAQDGNTIYFINNIPQSNYSNPASLPNCKFYLGIPGISSFGLNLENGSFSYNDVFSRRKSDDSLIVDKDKLLGALSDKNKLSYDISEQIFSLGFRAKRSYFTLSAATKVSTNFDYTKDLMTFLLKGNDAYLGSSKTANLSDSKLGLNAYTEVALGFSREIGKKLTLGVRFKYLIGMVNVYTERSSLLLNTNENTYELTASSDILIHSSSPFDSLTNLSKQIKNIKPSSLTDNTGYAFDFGGEYHLNKRWTIGVSVVDLGSINWKSNLKDYRSKYPKREVTFSGLDINQAFKGGKLDTTAINNLIDSLQEALGIKDYAGNSYNAPLKTKLYTSIAFSLTPNDRFGLLMRNDFANQSINTLVSVSYNRNIGRWFAITLSNTFVSGNLFNPGGGFNLSIGPIQFYLIGDHFSSIYAANMKNLGVHFGLNFIVGKTKQGYRYEKEKEVVIEEERPRKKKALLMIPVIADTLMNKKENIKMIDTVKIAIDTVKKLPLIDTTILQQEKIDTVVKVPVIDTVIKVNVDTMKNIIIPPVETIPLNSVKTTMPLKNQDAGNKAKQTIKKPAAVKPKAPVTTPKPTGVKPTKPAATTTPPKTTVVKPKPKTK